MASYTRKNDIRPLSGEISLPLHVDGRITVIKVRIPSDCVTAHQEMSLSERLDEKIASARRRMGWTKDPPVPCDLNRDHHYAYVHVDEVANTMEDETWWGYERRDSVENLRADAMVVRLLRRAQKLIDEKDVSAAADLLRDLHILDRKCVAGDVAPLIEKWTDHLVPEAVDDEY